MEKSKNPTSIQVTTTECGGSINLKTKKELSSDVPSSASNSFEKSGSILSDNEISSKQSATDSIPSVCQKHKIHHGLYQKLESTSITDQTSSINSTYDQNITNSNLDSTSTSFTLKQQSYSQLSSTISPTLTPTPLHALPLSSNELSSSNGKITISSPSRSVSSPPLSPITPLTNTVTPDVSSLQKMPSGKRDTQNAQYIFVAAHQISEAQEHERRNEIVEAVAKYREGVGTLLQGVQDSGNGSNLQSSYCKSVSNSATNTHKNSNKKGEDEVNVARRESIRRKTFQYLHRAEQLLSRLTRTPTSMTANVNNLPMDKDRSSGMGISGLLCSVDLLRQYRVLGVTNSTSHSSPSSILRRSGVLIAQLPQSKHTVAIKIIQKNSSSCRSSSKTREGGANLIPRGLQHMVPIICYHETDSAIFLVMKYISGGRLWDHIKKYVCQQVSPPSPAVSPQPDQCSLKCSSDQNFELPANIYSGRRLLMDPCDEVQTNKNEPSKSMPASVQKLKSCLSEKTTNVNISKVLKFDNNLPDECKLSKEIQSLDCQSTCDATTYDITSMCSISRFTDSSPQVIAQSGMARYTRIDTSSCASDTTMGAVEWDDTEVIEFDKQLFSKAQASQFKEKKRQSILHAASERLDWSRDMDASENEAKTTPIACLGKSELNLCGDDEFYGNPHVSKSLSAENLSSHDTSLIKNNVQHSTISTVNVTPLIKGSAIGGAVMECEIDGDNLSIGSDTLSGVSDDFSCSVSINQLNEEEKKGSHGAPSDLNLISECAISEGRKRPANTPDSSFAYLNIPAKDCLKSLCQSTSADVTADCTTFMHTEVLEESTTLNELNAPGAEVSTNKHVYMEKLISVDDREKVPSGNSKTDKSSSKETSELSKKSQMSASNENSGNGKKISKEEEEKCPSEATSVSSVTLPSFSASNLADRSVSEVASFDIEELIRNSRRLLQNVNVTLEQSKGKSVRPVPSEDSSTSIDQSELPLDSVSVGFDTPDMPSNSTRCSNISSDQQIRSKVLADNTYSSIPSIALDTSRTGLCANDASAPSMDKALRSPRKLEAPVSFQKNSVIVSSQTNPEANQVENTLQSLPKDSITSKEDSTNPSDIHTQIHLSISNDSPENEEDDNNPARTRIPMLERQPNFEKSDTSKSSFKPNDNVVNKVLKTIGGGKLSNESSPKSNDSTSISGLTLNNSTSPEDSINNDSTRQSSSILSLSTNDDLLGDKFSSESTSALKYVANPPDKSMQNVHKDENKGEHALSEPLYLMPEKERHLILNKSDLNAFDDIKEPGDAKSNDSVYENREAELMAENDPVTDSFTLYSCGSEQFNNDTMKDILTEGNLCTMVNDITLCNEESNTEFFSQETTTTSFQDFETSSKNTSSDNNNNSETLSKKKDKVQKSNGKILRKKKPSLMSQTPLSELLEKHWRGAEGMVGGRRDRRHLPEGLVKVWGAQIVTTMASLHGIGIVWGDFGPHNLLLGEGGSIMLTLESRWSCVERDRPFTCHSAMRCKKIMKTTTPSVGECVSVDESYKSTISSTTADSFTLVADGSRTLSSTTVSRGESPQSTESLCSPCLGYIAPELISPLATPTPASDWWGVGALLYHLLCGHSVASQHPSGFTSHTELYLPQHLSVDAKLLLSQLLTAHPSERLGGGPTGAQEIRHHSFFVDAPWP